MTGAYAGILNGGTSVKPYGLVELRCRGDSEALMGQGGGMGERVISENAARQLTYMMQQVVEHGTGTRARLPDREAAGKTGTTSSYRDAWFIGFTADYVVGVWMGNDDNSVMGGKVVGGGLPAEIWHDVMVRIDEGVPPRPLPTQEPTRPIYAEEYNPPANYDQGAIQPQPSTEARREPSSDERILLRLLNEVLGNRN
jgi:membrane peptidoglycan carboxypeptidase